MKKTTLTAMVLVVAAGAWAAPAPNGVMGAIRTANGVQKGAIKWSNKQKAYSIAQKKGGTMLDVVIKADDVEELTIDKPQGWDNAVAQVQRGAGASAIKYFERIAKDYAHLQWDLGASRYLAEAYLSANNAEKALDVCKPIIDADSKAAWKGELAPSYWKALLLLNKKSALESALAKAAASGDRFASGSALIMRGDLILANGGESAENVKLALTDGYLRVALLYTDKPVCDEVRPEALYKAAKCFEKMGQAARADLMRSTLKKEHANSPWAGK